MAVQNIWDFVLDGLFVEYIVALLGAIASTTNSFNVLLYAIFGKTVEDKLATVNATWVPTLQQVLSDSATMLKEIASTQGTVFPIGQYFITFLLIIGSVLGIVTIAMTSIRTARAIPLGAGAVPVAPAR